MKHTRPHPTRRLSLPAWLLLLTLGACSSPKDYFLLETAPGTPAGSMQIRSRQGDPGTPAYQLDAAHPTAMRAGDSTRAADLSPDQLRGRFTQALAAQPEAPQRFTLYFVEGSDTLTPESQAALQTVLAAIRQRPAPDLLVIGHTDRVGSVADNDKLSAKRAESIRQQLLKLGIDADNIVASGRGEREPLVATPDEVAEPRNRRVELLVR